MYQYFSYGGGVQSTAALVLAAEGKIKADAFLFANVGVDSEHPATLAYITQHVFAYARQHDIAFYELQKTRKDGSLDTIYRKVTDMKKRSIGIPVRMSNGAPGNRACTYDYKIALTAQYARLHGASRQHPAIMQLGISLDELQRMRNNSGISYIELAYPLIDLRLTRQDCIKIIEQAGLPVPPKSSCWFCPFHTLAKWQQMREQEPELFQKAVELEHIINKKRAMLGRDNVWLSGALKPLDKATREEVQLALFEEEYSCGPFTCSI